MQKFFGYEPNKSTWKNRFGRLVKKENFKFKTNNVVKPIVAVYNTHKAIPKTIVAGGKIIGKAIPKIGVAGGKIIGKAAIAGGTAAIRKVRSRGQRRLGGD